MFFIAKRGSAPDSLITGSVRSRPPEKGLLPHNTPTAATWRDPWHPVHWPSPGRACAARPSTRHRLQGCLPVGSSCKGREQLAERRWCPLPQHTVSSNGAAVFCFYLGRLNNVEMKRVMQVIERRGVPHPHWRNRQKCDYDPRRNNPGANSMAQTDAVRTGDTCLIPSSLPPHKKAPKTWYLPLPKRTTLPQFPHETIQYTQNQCIRDNILVISS